MKHVFVAGATGYLGRFLCSAFRKDGWHVTALVRSEKAGQTLDADRILAAEATQPETLVGSMDGVDLVVSALGITRQKDGLGYWDVDFQANANLLEEAIRAGVDRFAYVHVLHADRMQKVPLVQAKTAFVDRLQSAPIQSTVIAPSGYFSDMGDFLNMAKSGRVWLFGDGQARINPIHGADLALATVQAIKDGADWCDIGGPDTFSHDDLARLCFDVLHQDRKVAHLPDMLRRVILTMLPYLSPRSVHGPAQFFLTALGQDMVGDSFGSHRLKTYFESLVAQDLAQS